MYLVYSDVTEKLNGKFLKELTYETILNAIDDFTDKLNKDDYEDIEENYETIDKINETSEFIKEILQDLEFYIQQVIYSIEDLDEYITEYESLNKNLIIDRQMVIDKIMETTKKEFNE